mgnify:CR=1 FL=1
MSSKCSTINTYSTEKTNVDVQKTNVDVQKTNVDVISNKKIFRYKLSDDINDALAQFTSLYRFNNRKDLKENWTKWCLENTVIIQEEERRLLNLGYTGNCVTKMFTSVRYYHIKKANEHKDTEQINDNESSSNKKRKYFTLDKKILVIIDDHIRANMENNNFKPANSFRDFTGIHNEIIKETRDLFVSKGFTEEDFDIKLKKTYKNRYFNL